MKTREQLNALRKGELADELQALSEQLGEALPTGGTNAEMVERILTAQEMLSLEHSESEGIETGETGETESPVEPAVTNGNTFLIKAVSKAGFYRCGLFFPHEGAEVELTSEQLERIRTEPNLIIEE